MNTKKTHNLTLFSNLPQEIRRLQQWCLAGPDKAPYAHKNIYASVTDPSNWMGFETAHDKALSTGYGLGFVLTASDPYTCIDLDVKDAENAPDTPDAWTTPEELERYQRIIDAFDSYTERSLSGKGFHIWVRGNIGAGRRRDGVEVYSQERFIICTGNVYLDKPIENRQDLIDMLVSEIGQNKFSLLELKEFPEEESDDAILQKLHKASNSEKFVLLWEGGLQNLDYPSQSEADMALMSMLALYSPSNAQCRRLFRQSALGKREKAIKDDKYLNRTLQAIRSRREETIRLGKEFANSPRNNTGNDSWPPLKPIVSKTKGLPYPIHALPKKIRAAVEEVQHFTQAPLAMVASSALSSISLVVQGLVDVQRGNKLESPSSCFFLTIAETGERKTTCDRFFMKAIREYEKAHHGKNATTLKIPRFIYADITPEALAHELAKGWPSGGIISSEAGAIFGSHGMNKDSITRFLSLLNQLWDGIPFSIDRKTSDSIMIKSARFSMGLQCQSVVIQKFLTDSGILARGIGFLARFLVAKPESTQGSRRYIELPDEFPAMDVFTVRMTEILNMSLPFDENGLLFPKAISLSTEAKPEWIKLYNKIEVGLKEGGKYSEIRDVANRVAENVARVAAILHVFEYGFDGEIKLVTVKQAGILVEWHLSEARRLFSEDMPSEKQSQALVLEEWILGRCRENGTNCIPIKDLQQKGPPSLRRTAEYTAVMQELEALGRIRRISDSGRSFIELNPELLGV
ncbi:DUF3987 domain-containing protein [Oxalobacter vibrioformis]|uniref:DUF3987 domain-containing protein n=1 Tax=Oxalobacter vibrioformis TaxID=933080 RepID=A0A9E9P4E3_9BURK|nr:DUF3987 domain-containing protein [Oxalobacter vibrioformis]WAW10993.1 DUF3987 domain-containing protein [Oxalobacter vibrioformis]